MAAPSPIATPSPGLRGGAWGAGECLRFQARGPPVSQGVEVITPATSGEESCRCARLPRQRPRSPKEGREWVFLFRFFYLITRYMGPRRLRQRLAAAPRGATATFPSGIPISYPRTSLRGHSGSVPKISFSPKPPESTKQKKKKSEKPQLNQTRLFEPPGLLRG